MTMIGKVDTCDNIVVTPSRGLWISHAVVYLNAPATPGVEAWFEIKCFLFKCLPNQVRSHGVTIYRATNNGIISMDRSVLVANEGQMKTKVMELIKETYEQRRSA